MPDEKYAPINALGIANTVASAGLVALIGGVALGIWMGKIKYECRTPAKDEQAEQTIDPYSNRPRDFLVKYREVLDRVGRKQ